MVQTLTKADVGATVYDELGVPPVINARGNQTVLGGALLSPSILRAMEAANRYFADMDTLLRRTGEIAAELLECEAAYVTPGCAAALALGAAACMAGGDGAKMEHLPDTTGMKNQLVIQVGHRYKYDRPPTIFGARLVEAGDAQGTTARQLEDATGRDTAAVLFPAHLDRRPGTVPLADAIEIAHRRGVPVLLDAASQIYPVERLRGWTKMGADLVCFGAKYWGAPHSSGLICGRRALVESVARQGFIGFEVNEFRTLGRPLKLDRGEIIAVVLALREWVAMDHPARIARIQARVDGTIRRLEGLPGVGATSVPNAHFGAPGLRVQLDQGTGRTASEVGAALREGRPSIMCGHHGDSLHFNFNTVVEGDEEVIAERLRELLSG